MEALGLYMVFVYLKYAIMIVSVPLLFCAVGFALYCANEYRHWRKP